MMRIEEILLSTFEIARYISISPESIRSWCRNGILKSSRQNHLNTKDWQITGIAFSEFLYFNPKYRRRLEATLEKDPQEEAIVILSYLRNRPHRLYDICEVANIFHVTVEGVRYWVKSGMLPTQCDERGMYRMLFRDDDLEYFVASNPYYNMVYRRYLDGKGD